MPAFQPQPQLKLIVQIWTGPFHNDEPHDTDIIGSRFDLDANVSWHYCGMAELIVAAATNACRYNPMGEAFDCQHMAFGRAPYEEPHYVQGN
jgi:hypothetical protein